jgi:hypothetical protein
MIPVEERVLTANSIGGDKDCGVSPSSSLLIPLLVDLQARMSFGRRINSLSASGIPLVRRVRERYIAAENNTGACLRSVYTRCTTIYQRRSDVPPR